MERKTMKRTLTLFIACFLTIGFVGAQERISSVNLTEATIVYNEGDAPLVKQMAQVLADDIERVSGTRPKVDTR